MTKRRSLRKPLNTYHLGEEVLSHSPVTSDLGVSVSGNCTWNSNIEQMCAKSNRVLGLVKRLCGREICDVQTRKLLYTALVRPLLDKCVFTLLNKTSQTDREHSEACH